MVPSRATDTRPGARETVDRIYVVNSNSPSPQGRCYLDDGSAVICAFETVGAAKEATAGDPNLRLIRHRSLTSQEQQRVERALLA